MSTLTPDRLARNLRDLVGDLKAPRALIEATNEVVVRETRSVVRRIAYRTGELHNSIHGEVRRNQGVVVADAHHARFVHDGTRYMRARPFFDIGLRQAQPEVERVLEKQGEEWVRGLTK